MYTRYFNNEKKVKNICLDTVIDGVGLSRRFCLRCGGCAVINIFIHSSTGHLTKLYNINYIMLQSALNAHIRSIPVLENKKNVHSNTE